MKCDLECFALSQDGDPAKPALHGFENEHLEQAIVFVKRNAPLFVMIREIEWILTRPCTAFEFHRFFTET